MHSFEKNICGWVKVQDHQLPSAKLCQKKIAKQKEREIRKPKIFGGHFDLLRKTQFQRSSKKVKASAIPCFHCFLSITFLLYFTLLYSFFLILLEFLLLLFLRFVLLSIFFLYHLITFLSCYSCLLLFYILLPFIIL